MNTEEVTIYRQSDMYVAGIREIDDESMVVAPIHTLSAFYRGDEAILTVPIESEEDSEGNEEIYVEMWNKFIAPSDALIPAFNAVVQLKANDNSLAIDDDVAVFRTTEKINADIAYQNAMKTIFKKRGIW